MSRVTISGYVGIMSSNGRFETYYNRSKRRVYVGTYDTVKEALLNQCIAMGMTQDSIDTKMVDVFGAMSRREILALFDSVTNAIHAYLIGTSWTTKMKKNNDR